MGWNLRLHNSIGSFRATSDVVKMALSVVARRGDQPCRSRPGRGYGSIQAGGTSQPLLSPPGAPTANFTPAPVLSSHRATWQLLKGLQVMGAACLGKETQEGVGGAERSYPM